MILRLTQGALVAVLLYASQHAMLDSSGLAFENRLVEAMRLLEQNSHDYRKFVNDTIDDQLEDETGLPIEADFRLAR